MLNLTKNDLYLKKLKKNAKDNFSLMLKRLNDRKIFNQFDAIELACGEGRLTETFAESFEGKNLIYNLTLNDICEAKIEMNIKKNKLNEKAATVTTNVIPL